MSEDRPLVLVTGASGFLAGHVIQRAFEEGYRVRGTVRSKQNKHKYAYLQVLGPIELVEANLSEDQGWDEAVAGCDYIIHTASPYIVANVSEEELIGPAVNGTLRVLSAADRSGTVKRVVVTSSCASVSYGYAEGDKPEGYVFTPDDWSSPTIRGYAKSKMLAEKAAWDFAPAKTNFDVTTVNPAYIIGPLMTKKDCESASLCRQMLCDFPAVPRMQLGVVDVRDCAIVHVGALKAPEAPGKRLICSPDTRMLVDICGVLKTRMGKDGFNPTTRQLPDFMIRLAALFDPVMAVAVHDLGANHTHDSSETEKVIGFKFRDTDPAWEDMVRSQMKFGMIKKPKKSYMKWLVLAVGIAGVAFVYKKTEGFQESFSW